jgi:hypothetical protein
MTNKSWETALDNTTRPERQQQRRDSNSDDSDEITDTTDEKVDSLRLGGKRKKNKTKQKKFKKNV